MKGPVEFKGKLNGLYMVVDETAEFNRVVEYLGQLLRKKGDFYKGTRIIGLNGVTFSYKQKSIVEDVIENAGLFVESLEPYNDHIKPARKPAEEVKQEITETESVENIQKIEESEASKEIVSPVSSDSLEKSASARCDTQFVYGTMRSGKSVKFPGNIIVIGDVNPGAEIVAEGNVVVMGKMLGFVHAGSAGNDQAIVIANILKPTQIRISKYISVPPNDDDTVYSLVPEKAYVSEGLIKIDKCH